MPTGAVAKACVALSLLLLAAAAPQGGRDPPKAASHFHKSRPHPPAHATRRSPGQQSAPVARDDARAFTAAPRPNPDLQAPVPPENRSPHVAPTLFDFKTDYIGDGYVYGSSPQGMDDRRSTATPGVKLTVPVP